MGTVVFKKELLPARHYYGIFRQPAITEYRGTYSYAEPWWVQLVCIEYGFHAEFSWFGGKATFAPDGSHTGTLPLRSKPFNIQVHETYVE